MSEDQPIVTETLCEKFVNGEVCNKPKIDVIHMPLRQDPYEHIFTPGGVYKERYLTRKNLRKIARESGKKEIELEMMLFMFEKQGKKQKIRYRVVGS